MCLRGILSSLRSKGTRVASVSVPSYYIPRPQPPPKPSFHPMRNPSRLFPRILQYPSRQLYNQRMAANFSIVLSNLSLHVLLSLIGPLCLGALVCLLRLIRTNKAYRFPVSRLFWLLPFLDVFVWVSIAAIGVLGMVDPQAKPFPHPNQTGLITCNVLALSSLVGNIIWIYLMKGQKVFAMGVSAFQLGMLLLAYLTSAMALTGKWI